MCTKICFLSDGYKIKGNLHLPDRRNPPVVIGSHGLLASQESPKQIALAKACNDVGIAFFRFDHRGCGRSEGKNKDRFSFETRCLDLLRACETIRRRPDTGQGIGIFGSSLGGAVACRVSSMVRADAAVTFASPVSSKCLFDVMQQHGLSSEYSEEIYTSLFFDNEDILNDIQNILVVHGEQDEWVPVSESRRIFEKAQNPKELVILEGGDHRMSSEKHQQYFVRKAAGWFNKAFERS